MRPSLDANPRINQPAKSALRWRTAAATVGGTSVKISPGLAHVPEKKVQTYVVLAARPIRRPSTRTPILVSASVELALRLRTLLRRQHSPYEGAGVRIRICSRRQTAVGRSLATTASPRHRTLRHVPVRTQETPARCRYPCATRASPCAMP